MVLLLPSVGLGQFELKLTETLPTTQRSTATTAPVGDIRKLIEELGDRDAAIRAAARFHLMGMSREDLKKLKETLKNTRGLTTAQRSALRDVVLHVFLATEPYEAVMRGFLGVKDLAAVKVAREEHPAQKDGEAADEGRVLVLPDARGGIVFIPEDLGGITAGMTGVVVSDRLLGACAYRAMDNGDVILAVKDEGGTARLRSVYELQHFIRERHLPGDTVSLQVLRRGKVLDVTLTLDAFPSMINQQAPGSGEEFRRVREQAAERYWQENFAALLGERVL